MLSDDLKKAFNIHFEKSNIPIKINELVLFRPVMHEPPFEHIEVINDAKRFLDCNNLNMVISIEQNDRRYECELRYKNENGKLQNTEAQLQYCDIMPNENIENLQRSILETFKLLGMLINSTVESMVKKKEENT